MIYRDDLNSLYVKFYRKPRSILRNAKGQTLVEYSLLLAITSSFTKLLDNPLILIAIVVLIVSLLIWKPKISTVIYIALILVTLLLISRWAEYGHF